MSSSFQIPRRLPSVVVLVLAALPAALTAQAPAKEAEPGPAKALVALGASLFNDPRLSSTGSMSCATCHRPDRSFTEEKPRAIGQTGLALGRNTPTLLGLASVKEFPVGGSSSAPPSMVTLEERVVVPLRDETEMCARVGEAMERLARDPSCVETFNAVFEAPATDADDDREPAGITGDRIAKALAEYIRSLKHYEGPSHAALAGADVVLEAPVRRGLKVFRGEGRCQSCHSGPALTDGNLHIVRRRVPADDRPQRPDTRPGRGLNRVMGGYGRTQTPERQTLTLLDVRRTGPYFRNGSVAVLSDAVRQHVADLREVGAVRRTFLADVSNLTSMGSQCRNPTAPFSASATAQLASDAWIPKELTAQQLDDVVAFLGSLSPGD